ncbi:MAG TPA: molybdopterin-dependent oxidoreductase [Candidatus Baltobacteraceae bacterium]|nr:molybdopterin-dependent oxidoreductase [Candidatus Baltobacteraceae bacterium]
MADTQDNLVTVTIDGTPVQVPKGTLLVEAAKQIKSEIPVYCYHSKMGPAGLCRICLVEVEGMPKLQIGCNTPVADGMVVRTQSDKASDGRRAVLELYLKNHPLDCPICDKGGECDLQDYAMAYGQDYSRSVDPKVPKPKAVDLGPTIVLDEERCVVCQRCVRFDDIIVGERELVLKDRGVRNIIATATGEPYRHNFTGNVTELCPVGALTSKTYRFKSRPWDLARTTTSCTQCSVGCQMHVDARVGKVMRTMSVEADDAISDTWLCDRGRYNLGFYESADRITQPLYKQNGEWIQIGWDDAISIWADAISAAVAANPKTAGVIGGGRLTNEEAYLLQSVFRKAGVQNLDWRAGRQLQATPGKGSASIADLETANVIFIVGESPAQLAPVFDLRVRKAAFQKGAKLVRIGSFERRYPAPIPSTDVAGVREAVAAIPDGAQRIAVIWDGVDLAAAGALMQALPQSATVMTYIPGEQPNARGAEAMGMLPAADALDTSAMLAAAADGSFAALSIFGANPALHYPDGAFVREALGKVPFIAVSELFMTETAQLATLVLPALGPFEKSGTTINLGGDLLAVNAARGLNAPEGPLSDLEMIARLAEALKVDVPTHEGVHEAVVQNTAKAHGDFTLGDQRFARTALPQATGDGLRARFQSDIFAGGGTSAHDDRIDTLRPLPQAAFSAEDAQALGVKTGDYVDLSDGKTVMHDLLVEVRPRMPKGSVALLCGLPDDPANCFADGSILSATNVRSSQLVPETV